ncbi:HlyD family type I secretion periplasmic adaptor subunit [Rickettsia endosymbiont of Oedothorax gibbosus]|uniref:HlyD family type I secretion periplasmic adaptor subunit n=1 Tax=Rickettsia endosymbiont of Oedothorax gibbosus TaxID=931099 RepID=UPI002024101C|nr:HlyD family type I secretion periplasmic adaptor subunit [Rickettsia endosymbiont of Oedothorax gibbosus]
MNIIKQLLLLKNYCQQDKLNNKLKNITSKIRFCWYRARSYFQSHYAEYEFLPSHLELIESPPSATARITAIAISILVLLALIWSYFSHLDIHATATGRLILPSRSQTIQAYELSEVAEILVKNGQHVKCGDRLLVLNIVGITQEIRRLQEQRYFQQLELARYQVLLSDEPLNALIIPDHIEELVAIRSKAHLVSIWQEHQAILAKFDAELAANQSEQIANQASIVGLQKLLHNIQQRLAPSRELLKSKFVSKTELLAKEKEVLETELSITVKQQELEVLKARANTIRENKVSYIAQKYREWHDNLNKSQSVLSTIEQELAKVQERDRLQILRAPMDGIVQQLAVYTVGGIVQGAQTLMMITPHDAPQQAEVNIANKDVGFISPGQSVTVKIEAFPYSRYGTISGQVQSISLDSVKLNESSSELIFPAQIELAQNHIMIDNNLVTLTPGMSVVAEIKIGKRRVIDYLLSPVQEYKSEAWREP